MKIKEKRHRRVIETESGAEYERLFEEAMEELGKYGPVVIDKLNAKGHCSYIEWIEEVKIPDDIREEMHLDDIYFNCGQCPYFIYPGDGRVKYFYCKKMCRKVSDSSDACLWVYQQVAKGEIQIDD